MLVVGAVEQGVAPDMRTLRISQAVNMEGAQYQKRTQQSVHPTGGILRVNKQFAWLEAGSVKMELSRPAHQPVTQAVRRLNRQLSKSCQ